jgi:hypothetical protein
VWERVEGKVQTLGTSNMSESRQYAYGSYVANGKHNPKSLPLATLVSARDKCNAKRRDGDKRNNEREGKSFGQNLFFHFHQRLLLVDNIISSIFNQSNISELG